MANQFRHHESTKGTTLKLVQPNYCSSCGQAEFPEIEQKEPYCRCNKYIVTDSSGAEHVVIAGGEEDAALTYARTSNEDGDDYLLDEACVVSVNGIKFSISAEKEIYYSAVPVY